ncbi:uncharacterized protein EKO05_0010622 [Ascochyta rabiei]|uniref:Cellular response to amino acid stimulus n=1 Tax=Didymella rabiei TaxID=5454 RepID=A0A162ZKS4_DIDRA|nr:uncharacterized protein EKO05_0010622 [Ascochyta rabiei]KZM20662.1 cellular response to amino acid stimulus [Ascochyta rabiei]UPX20389.1 hypothetical protein EKO05_0010622 [Ascochyta rabiei]
MGICSSCLGGRSDEDPSDASQLLGDGYQPQYGTLDARPQHAPLPDPEEIRREREALEQICADTSSQLITVVQPTAQPDADQPHVSETTDYAQHFSKRFPSLRGLNKRPAPTEDADVDEAAWLDSALGGDDDNADDPVKPVQGGLTRQFGK